MTNTTLRDRGMATVAGLAFTTGALIILLGSAVITPRDWTSHHVLTILAVFGTIFAGHQITTAWRARSIAVIGYAIVFIVGTGLVVYNSVGNQAEKAGSSVASAADINARIKDKTADLKSAKARKANAEREADGEMKGQLCRDRCKAWKQNAVDIGNAIKTLEAEIAALGPQRPVNIKAERMAEVAALFGADHAQAKAALMLIEPFLWTLFFEIGSIVSLGFAFRHTPAGALRLSSVEPAATRGASQPSDDPDLSALRDRFFAPDAQPDGLSSALQLPTSNRAERPSAEIIAIRSRLPDTTPNGSPDNPDDPRPRKRAKGPKAAVLSDIRSRIDRGERFESQEQLRSALNADGRFGHIARSSLSDWLGEEADTIVREIEGRRKRVG
jgi:hypothetical protein